MSLTKTQMFGENKGALRSWEHTLDGAEVTVASSSAESWHQVRDEYPTEEVTFCRDKSADIFWRGTTQQVTSSFQRRTDVVLTPEGLKLYPGWYGEDKTLTYWVSDTENYRFVLSIYRGDVVVTCWRNTKVNNKWRGRVHQFRTGTRYNAGDWQLPSSEQRAVLWLMKAVSKVAG